MISHKNNASMVVKSRWIQLNLHNIIYYFQWKTPYSEYIIPRLGHFVLCSFWSQLHLSLSLLKLSLCLSCSKGNAWDLLSSAVNIWWIKNLINNLLFSSRSDIFSLCKYKDIFKLAPQKYRNSFMTVRSVRSGEDSTNTSIINFKLTMSSPLFLLILLIISSY